MIETLGQETTSFMPHGFCFLWTPSLLWTYVISDSIIGIAYFSIPFALWYFVRNRQDLPYRWIFILFGLFVMSCGTTHFFEVLDIWQADYWADASIKAFTAVVSAIAAIALWRIMPYALAIPSRSQLESVNNELKIEIKRREAEEERSAELLVKLKSALAHTQKFTQDIFDNAPVLIYAADTEGKIILANKSFLTLFGLNRDQLIGHGREDVMPKVIADEHRKNDIEVMQKAAHIEFEETNIESDGLHNYNSHKFPLIDPKGKIYGVCGISSDITDRKKSEIALIKSNRALAALSAVNHSLVHATDEPGLLLAVCQAIVRQSTYRMAWVGYLQHDEAKTIRVVAQDGVDEGYLERAMITWADTERGRGPSGIAARSGKTVAVTNFLTDDRVAPWREEAAKRGYAAVISLPLIQGGTVFGVLTIFSGYADAFDHDEVSLLEEMANDMAYGVISLRIRSERDHAIAQVRDHMAKLENNLEDTVNAISTIVEMRDPYTAGHQNKVAELAVAIAREMGLPDEQVHGIHLGGIVHDLGKIQVPAEILSMPRRLTEVEYALIKDHPQAGYDILKDIDFPWPIAQMVLEHHERLDGSGYPHGLKDEAILLEARILCVADVVEAMSSHRPYRPGLGIDVALNEIRKGRGTIYDTDVADACLKVFAEGRFKL